MELDRDFVKGATFTSLEEATKCNKMDLPQLIIKNLSPASDDSTQKIRSSFFKIQIIDVARDSGDAEVMVQIQDISLKILCQSLNTEL